MKDDKVEALTTINVMKDVLGVPGRIYGHSLLEDVMQKIPVPNLKFRDPKDPEVEVECPEVSKYHLEYFFKKFSKDSPYKIC